MMQYLIILLDDTSVSFCHYENVKMRRNLMSMDILKAGVLYGMKENLNIQFVYPDYELPEEYRQFIETVDHIKIKPVGQSSDADVTVLNGVSEIESVQQKSGVAYVLRLSKNELFSNVSTIARFSENVERLNIVLTDVETFSENDFVEYKKVLFVLMDVMKQIYIDGKSPQLNILTDRMMLEAMNNCGAGDTNIALAPDGMFYVCPAFYQSTDSCSVGSLVDGLEMKNAQLYKLNYAPLCRHCDAYQCRRCIWLNRKTTLEVNTPSHEQCVIAYLERDVSRRLLFEIGKSGIFMPNKEDIREIDYLDPFEIREKW